MLRQAAGRARRWWSDAAVVSDASCRQAYDVGEPVTARPIATSSHGWRGVAVAVTEPEDAGCCDTRAGY